MPSKQILIRPIFGVHFILGSAFVISGNPGSGLHQRPAPAPHVASRRDENGEERGGDEREDQRLPAEGRAFGVKDDTGGIVDESDGQLGRQRHRPDRDVEPRGGVAARLLRKEVAVHLPGAAQGSQPIALRNFQSFGFLLFDLEYVAFVDLVPGFRPLGHHDPDQANDVPSSATAQAASFSARKLAAPGPAVRISDASAP